MLFNTILLMNDNIAIKSINRVMWIPVAIMLMIKFGTMIAYAVKKSKMTSQIQSLSTSSIGPTPSAIQHFNNTALNETMLKWKETTLVIFLVSTIILPFTIVSLLEQVHVREFLLMYFFVCYSACVIILPMVYFIKYPRRLNASVVSQ